MTTHTADLLRALGDRRDLVLAESDGSDWTIDPPDGVDIDTLDHLLSGDAGGEEIERRLAARGVALDTTGGVARLVRVAGGAL